LLSLWGASIAAIAIKWEVNATTKPMIIVSIKAFIFIGLPPPSLIIIAIYLPSGHGNGLIYTRKCRL
jgi:hypothetical protein